MKFSTRNLLLVTVIVALAVGWWVDHRWIASLERERDAALDDAGWLSRQLSSHIENAETAERAAELIKKYEPLPNLKAPAPNQPEP